VLQQIPRSVLWGFFAFMALEGLPGNQFYKRLLLFLTDSSRLSVGIRAINQYSYSYSYSYE
jgi:hypothetical protein